MKIAHVNGGDSSRFGEKTVRSPYSNRVTSLLGGKPQPDISTEDLGSKEINGFEARGVKLTEFGKPGDGEWDGKPIKILEMWASDDLAVTILQIRKNLKDGAEEQSIFTNINRAEPDASLFEVPPGYKINPTSDEMPFRPAH
jgi:hypothetical protein